mmetsp:Transcript_28028/g.64161  ORF Transcript_28028/g.64161 Transcript_28028/m.64161 type:complete len:466 (-) Transcript_28028:52-1449(-)
MEKNKVSLQEPHDLVALGHYTTLIQNVMSNINDNGKSPTPPKKLIERLPVLMRLLSLLQQRFLSQNHAQLMEPPQLASKVTSHENEAQCDNLRNNIKPHHAQKIHSTPNSIEEIYSMLEDAAASIPEAEEVEGPVALAPSVCKTKLGKISGSVLRKRRRRRCRNAEKFEENIRPPSAHLSSSNLSNSTDSKDLIGNELWLTSSLTASLRTKAVEKNQIDDDIDLYGMEGMGDNDEDEDKDTRNNSSKFLRLSNTNDKRLEKPLSMVETSDDSQEVTMGLILLEIVELIVKSLDQQNLISNDIIIANMKCARLGHTITDLDKSGIYFTQNTTFFKSENKAIQTSAEIATKKDSILSSTDTDSLSALLSTTIPVLMYHAPVLRHRHVANVLCRSVVPQAVSIISRLAENSPAASSSLTRGCIDAYCHSFLAASKTETVVRKSIIQKSTAAVKSIADLSARECANVKR